jgi:acyl-homoserine lactone acylase PvdQ
MIGINAYIRSSAFKLPVEMTLAWINPSEWNALDVFAIARFLSWQMSYGWYTQVQ